MVDNREGSVARGIAVALPIGLAMWLLPVAVLGPRGLLIPLGVLGSCGVVLGLMAWLDRRQQ